MEKESFLDLYLRYTEKQESPEIFHLWVAYTLIGSVLGKKVWFDKGYYRLHCNLFTVLVAGSAWTRKSTAVDMGVGFLDGVHSLSVVNGRITPEKFIQRLGDESEYSPVHLAPACKPTLIHADELNVFLTRQSYGDPMIGLLTRLFACPARFSNETKHSGSSFLYDPYVSIIACTTPQTIAKSIPPSALDEGFGNRVMWIFQDVSDRENPLPKLSPEEEETKIILATKLEEIAMVNGEFKFTPEAEAWYKDWYHHYRRSVAPDPRVVGMYSRKHDHLIRLSMILSASAGISIMDEYVLEAALMSLDQMEAYAPGAFSELGGDEGSARVARLKVLMKHLHRGAYSYIMRRMMPITAPQFKEAIETGYDNGWLKRDAADGKVLVYVDVEEV